MLAKLRQYRNLLLILLGICGFVVTARLWPEVDIKVKQPPISDELQDQSFPLPRFGPRSRGLNPFEKTFLFELGDTAKMTGKAREDILQLQYDQIVKGLTGQDVKVEIQQNDVMTVVAVDGKPFATVLSADAPEYYSKLSDSGKKRLEYLIAANWKHLLEVDLAHKSFQRSPESAATHPYLVIGTFFFTLIFHGLADIIASRFLHSPGWSLKGFVWLSFLSFLTLVLPPLAPLAGPLVHGAVRPIFFFLLIWTVCQILHRVGCVMLERYAEAYISGQSDVASNRRQRVETAVQGGRFLVSTVVVLLGGSWFGAALGIDLGQIYAGAGVAGIALGVVGKDILIDYFYGVNILLDDHFRLGDFIETPVATGIVESFNLRTTRIREIDGGLSIVTNGKMNFVKNHSREFANADFRIGIPYDTDTARPLDVIREEIAKMFEQELGVLDSVPVFTGVHQLAESAVVLRSLVKTYPLQQWAVTRELNRRVLQRFQDEGIPTAVPTRQVFLQSADSAASKEQ